MKHVAAEDLPKWPSASATVASARQVASVEDEIDGDEEVTIDRRFNPFEKMTNFDATTVDFAAVWNAFEATRAQSDCHTALCGTVGYFVVGIRGRAALQRMQLEFNAEPPPPRRSTRPRASMEEEAVLLPMPPAAAGAADPARPAAKRPRTRAVRRCSFAGCIHQQGGNNTPCPSTASWGMVPSLSKSTKEAVREKALCKRQAFLRRVGLDTTETGDLRVCPCHYDGDVCASNITSVGVKAGGPASTSRVAAERRRATELLHGLGYRDFSEVDINVVLEETLDENARLRAELAQLRAENASLKQELQVQLPPLQYVQLEPPEQWDLLHHYTGFSSAQHFTAFLCLLGNGSADVLSGMTVPGTKGGSSRGRPRTLGTYDEALLYFHYERCGTSTAVLARLYGVSETIVLRTVGD